MSDIEPRLLGAKAAAAYCGIGATLFMRECPFQPIRIGDRKLWDVQVLDAWIDRLSGRGPTTLEAKRRLTEETIARFLHRTPEEQAEIDRRKALRAARWEKRRRKKPDELA